MQQSLQNIAYRTSKCYCNHGLFLTCALMRTDEQNSFVLVTGPPGSGKSLYTTWLLALLQAQKQSQDSVYSDWLFVKVEGRRAHTVAQFCQMLLQVF